MTSSTCHSRNGTTKRGMTPATFDVEVSSMPRTCPENSHLALSACLQKHDSGFVLAWLQRRLSHMSISAPSSPIWQQGGFCKRASELQRCAVDASCLPL